jgi:hypothetical protein
MRVIQLRTRSQSLDADQDFDVRTCTAALYHLIITLHVGGDEDNLGSKALPRVFEELHSIRPASSFLRVPENHFLGLDMFVN